MERMLNLMNKTLFKATLKANWTIGLFIILMLLIYMIFSITMFDPANTDKIEGMLKMMPEGMIKAFGFHNLGTDLTGYLANYHYGFIFLIFPMLYSAIVANRLIAKHVDNGSMAYLLTTPNTRVKIAITQAIYLVSSIAVIFVVVIGIAIAMSELMFSGQLKINQFIVLNVVTFLTTVVASGISFLFSCLFNETRNSLAFGTGIPLVFIIIRMLTAISEKIAWLKYFSIYSFINIEKIFGSNAYVINSSLILLAMGLGLYVTAIIIFNRRNLSI